MSANIDPENAEDVTATSESEADIDYEPTEEDFDDMEDEDEDDEDGEDDGDDDVGIAFLQRLLADNGVDIGSEEEGEVEIEIEEDEGADAGEEAGEDERRARQRRMFARLLASGQIGRLFNITRGGAEDEDDDGSLDPRFRRNMRRRPDPDRFPKVPSENGMQLMNSGTFGSNESHSINAGEISKKEKVARRILDRELATEDYVHQKLNQKLMAQGMIPSSTADMIIHYDQPVYSGQFSDDGNFFFSANKDFRVRMYDTSNPYKWRYYKTVEYPFGRWTLTDSTLSPDNKYMAYTSIHSIVALAPTDPNDLGDPYNLDLSDMGNGRRVNFGGRGPDFGIWSVRFSGDGRQLVAGASEGGIVVYDIESRRATNQINGHEEDVNAVCFADSSSPHILYSGSDDSTLKVWDTRSMGDNRAAGAFVGHIEGLTYIDSKGDGRYILSNGKDQSMKLWDLRMVMSPSDFRALPGSQRRSQARFDYRWGAYDEDDWQQHPSDNSVVTFRGHKVLRTLIRCHFSPPGSTNSRYVYSGSEDGKVYIWNMDATLAGTVDVYAATKNSRPAHRAYHMMGAWDGDEDYSRSRWKTCVRDASWHPSAPMIVASAWNGYGMTTGTCTVHSWNDGAEDDEAEPKMGLRVNQKLVADPALYEQEPERPRVAPGPFRGLLGGRLIGGRLYVDDDDEDD